MLGNNIYFAIKPFVPVSIRRGVRRWLVQRQRTRCNEIWPILPGSERPPIGWPGWPNGKKFSFVLTHDIEGAAGLAKCRQLMELEMKYGFRSSFNFIPEGDYKVTQELREELTRNGFEVGVHDLHHDGKLYGSRSHFASKAKRINQHLKEWNSVGFRSGFMLHNLEWLQDLDIEYDASTFDTDPFEPQPDGVGTIFPFWKEGRNGKGFVELPYTIPQDSTLFLLCGESSSAIWTRKLDWVAQNGGMALMNVHPDYINFGQESDSYTFPVDIYSDFLRHVQKTYADSVWHVLPREVAAYAKRIKPLPPYRPKRVCMVTNSCYLTDARVIRYAEALAAREDQVDVLSLRRFQDAPVTEVVNGVNIVCLQSRFKRNEKFALAYIWPIMRFLWASMWTIFREHRRKKYDFIHVHNVPDFLVMAAAYPRMTGTKVILDIHDIVPEFYASKFSKSANSIVVLMLKWMEWVSSKLADHIIISNDLWREKYVARTGTDDRCSVFVNNVDSRIFCARPRVRNDGKFIMIFPGGFQWHQGLDIALRAFKEAVPNIPQAEFHLYGDGNAKSELMQLAKDLGLNGSVKFFEPLPVRDVAKVMADADIGVVPKRADSFGDEAYSTKIMEFMSLGVPVIVSSTKIDRYYFNDSVVRFFKSGEVQALAEAMVEMSRKPEMRQEMAARAFKYARENSWEKRKADYLDLVDNVCGSDR